MTRRPRALPALLLAPLVFASFAALSGCSPYALTEAPVPPVAAFGPAPRTDVATVCVIRPSHFAVGVTFVVHDDGQLVGATRGESWFCYWAAPGRHTIVSSTGDPVDRDGAAELTAEAGRRYWLHQDYENLLGVILDRLQWVNEERARELLEDGSCGYKTLAGVPGSEKLPVEVPLAAAR
ncbi:MAG TPA: hypothetical protein VGG39_32095 [Polyangiaceae bacterium]|jgi:hypothetical protein